MDVFLDAGGVGDPGPDGIYNTNADSNSRDGSLIASGWTVDHVQGTPVYVATVKPKLILDFSASRKPFPVELFSLVL